jgi:hypothetical protein
VLDSKGLSEAEWRLAAKPDARSSDMLWHATMVVDTQSGLANSPETAVRVGLVVILPPVAHGIARAVAQGEDSTADGENFVSIFFSHLRWAGSIERITIDSSIAFQNPLAFKSGRDLA